MEAFSGPHGTGVGPVGLAPGQAEAAIPTLPCTSTSYSTTSTYLYLPDLLGTVRVRYITGLTLKKSADNQIPLLLFVVPSPAVDRRLRDWRISNR